MTSIEISLPEPALCFIQDQVASGKYTSASDVVVDLVEKARIQAAKTKLTELIKEGLESGEGVELTDEWRHRRGEEIRAEAKGRGLA
jgi:antitoxin ParD1/3/4